MPLPLFNVKNILVSLGEVFSLYIFRYTIFSFSELFIFLGSLKGTVRSQVSASYREPR